MKNLRLNVSIKLFATTMLILGVSTAGFADLHSKKDGDFSEGRYKSEATGNFPQYSNLAWKILKLNKFDRNGANGSAYDLETGHKFEVPNILVGLAGALFPEVVLPVPKHSISSDDGKKIADFVAYTGRLVDLMQKQCSKDPSESAARGLIGECTADNVFKDAFSTSPVKIDADKVGVCANEIFGYLDSLKDKDKDNKLSPEHENFKKQYTEVLKILLGKEYKKEDFAVGLTSRLKPDNAKLKPILDASKLLKDKLNEISSDEAKANLCKVKEEPKKVEEKKEEAKSESSEDKKKSESTDADKDKDKEEKDKDGKKKPKAPAVKRTPRPKATDKSAQGDKPEPSPKPESGPTFINPQPPTPTPAPESDFDKMMRWKKMEMEMDAAKAKPTPTPVPEKHEKTEPKEKAAQAPQAGGGGSSPPGGGLPLGGGQQPQQQQQQPQQMGQQDPYGGYPPPGFMPQQNQAAQNQPSERDIAEKYAKQAKSDTELGILKGTDAIKTAAQVEKDAATAEKIAKLEAATQLGQQQGMAPGMGYSPYGQQGAYGQNYPMAGVTANGDQTIGSLMGAGGASSARPILRRGATSGAPLSLNRSSAGVAPRNAPVSGMAFSGGNGIMPRNLNAPQRGGLQGGGGV